MPNIIQGQTILLSLEAYHVIAISSEHAWLHKLEFNHKSWSYEKVGKPIKADLDSLENAKLDTGIA